MVKLILSLGYSGRWWLVILRGGWWWWRIVGGVGQLDAGIVGFVYNFFILGVHFLCYSNILYVLF